ncbi:MAG: hypothetical protein RR397_03585 [Odoribacter sp.]
MKKIINNILHRFKEDSLSKRNEAVERIVEYQSLKDIKTCLIFWVADANQNEWLRQFIQHFPNVKINKLCFISSGVEMLVTDDIVVMHNEDLGFGGKIQNDSLLAMLKERYDLFVDLTTVSNAMIDYVLLNSQAKCIVGMKKEGARADITIDSVSGQLEFIDKLAEILVKVNKY